MAASRFETFYKQNDATLHAFHERARSVPPSQRPALPGSPFQHKVSADEFVPGLSKTPVRFIGVHFTGLPAAESTPDSIWKFHTKTRRFDDIAYNWHIDNEGKWTHGRPVFEDSAANGANVRQGGRALSPNDNTLNIVLGVGLDTPPSRAMMESFYKVAKRMNEAYGNKLVFAGHSNLRPGGTDCPYWDLPNMLGLDENGRMTKKPDFAKAEANNKNLLAQNPVEYRKGTKGYSEAFRKGTNTPFPDNNPFAQQLPFGFNKAGAEKNKFATLQQMRKDFPALNLAQPQLMANAAVGGANAVADNAAPGGRYASLDKNQKITPKLPGQPLGDAPAALSNANTAPMNPLPANEGWIAWGMRGVSSLGSSLRNKLGI
jgi:hypothetical protein